MKNKYFLKMDCVKESQFEDVIKSLKKAHFFVYNENFSNMDYSSIYNIVELRYRLGNDNLIIFMDNEENQINLVIDSHEFLLKDYDELKLFKDGSLKSSHDKLQINPWYKRTKEGLFKKENNNDKY